MATSDRMPQMVMLYPISAGLPWVRLTSCSMAICGAWDWPLLQRADSAPTLFD